MDRAHPPPQQHLRHLADFGAQADAPGQRLLDQHSEPRQPMRRIERAAGGVLDPERVQRHAVGHGVDARIDDRGAGHRQRAGNLAEQAGVVGAVHRDLGHRARRQRLRIDRQRRVACLRIAHQPGVARMRLRIERQPVAGIAECGEALDVLLRPVGQQRRRRLARTLRPARRARWWTVRRPALRRRGHRVRAAASPSSRSIPSAIRHACRPPSAPAAGAAVPATGWCRPRPGWSSDRRCRA